jgi:hypothetical protein
MQGGRSSIQFGLCLPSGLLFLVAGGTANHSGSDKEARALVQLGAGAFLLSKLGCYRGESKCQSSSETESPLNGVGIRVQFIVLRGFIRKIAFSPFCHAFVSESHIQSLLLSPRF